MALDRIFRAGGTPISRRRGSGRASPSRWPAPTPPPTPSGGGPAPDEGGGAGLPDRRDGDLPGVHMGAENGAAAWVGYVRGRGRGRHGRRARRLVRGDRAVQASARHPDPAHRDHHPQEGPARRGPGHLRPGELPVAGGGRDQAARRAGRRADRQVAVGARARRAGRRRGVDRAARAGRTAARRRRPAGDRPDDRPAHRRTAVGPAGRGGCCPRCWPRTARRR